MDFSELCMETWFQKNEQRLFSLSHELFSFAETAHHEVRSSAAIAAYLVDAGFDVEKGIAGMETAFRAVSGHGRPIIGFLGEYDALPGLFQPNLPAYHGDSKKNGHGCGHNLLGVGSAAAAACLASALKQKNLPGTVVYYGCPAEETLEGKVCMAAEGCFRELDVALSWHPQDQYLPGNAKYQAMDSIEFSFHGKTAHAAIAPDQGRSALDACELMSVGVNYLREHIRQDVRIHYVYLDAGKAPNIVPDYARVWYYIRCKDGDVLRDTTQRVRDIARGAALMTGTQAKEKVLSRGTETRLNPSLIALLYAAMQETPMPEYTEQELEFALELRKSLQLPSVNTPYSRDILAPSSPVCVLAGSTDLSNVSQIVPTAFIIAACMPRGVPLHHWSASACADGSAARKGMIYAAMVLAKSGYRLMTSPVLLEQVKRDFARGGNQF